jgi:hypothetical protein
MGIQDIYAAVKRATVAIVLEFPDRIPARPFTIVGSGLCIHPAGVVVTCEHVFRAFVDPAAYQRVMEAVKEGASIPSTNSRRQDHTPCSSLGYRDTKLRCFRFQS